MATPHDAELILKLYELRREEVMRKARAFMISEFFPESFDDIKALWADREHPERSAYFRQVVTFWDMAAALVNHGSLDAGLFFDANSEHLGVWTKVAPFIAQLREVFGPTYLGSLETLVEHQPDAEKRIAIFKERFKQLAAMRAAQAQKA
jgi:hypothetical protein